MTNPAPASILKTSAKNIQPRKEEEPPTVRCSDRLAVKNKIQEEKVR
jgi:hypothetical protein